MNSICAIALIQHTDIAVCEELVIIFSAVKYCLLGFCKGCLFLNDPDRFLYSCMKVC